MNANSERFLAMIQQGRSFSGRERHCSFLNLRDGTFADVSAISGIDLPEDGRGAAICDWDGDGDLDIWLANRTGPMVRLLKNSLDAKDNFVAVKLQGVKCNRDAIGARLELHLIDSDVPLIQTVRAGDAFLSQSSKWQHFGLPGDARIEHLIVRWPGGEAETIAGIEAGERYHIRQGAGSAVAQQSQRNLNLTTEPIVPRPAQQAAKVFTHAPIPLPKLEYQSFDGRKHPAASDGEQTLIVLWASWCAPCIAELKEIAVRKGQFDAAGVDVLALSVDGLTDSAGGDLTAAERLIDQMNFPFRAGKADAKLVDMVQIGHDFVFDLHQPLPIPSSMLLGLRGEMQSLIEGPVEIDSFLTDATAVHRMPTGTERRSYSLPFAGRWIVTLPMRDSVGDLVIRMIDRGYLDEAEQYIRDNRRLLRAGPNYAAVLISAAKSLEEQQRYEEAAAHYRTVLDDTPGHLQALGRLARLLAACPDDKVRDGKEARKWADKAVSLAGEDDYAIMGVLAIVHAENGEFSLAVQKAAKAVELARAEEQFDIIPDLQSRVESFRNEKPFRFN